MTKSQLASNQLLMSLLLHKNKKNSILWSQLAAHMSNIKPIQPNKLTRTSKEKKNPSTTLLHWYMLVESLTGRLNFGGVDEEDMSYWTGTLITGCQSSIHHHLTDSHLLDSISRHCGHTHAHTRGESLMYIISHINDCQVSFLQWAGMRGGSEGPLATSPCQCSLFTQLKPISGGNGTGKVINPALQQGQDSSIKPVQKDSSIFNYCWGKLAKAALLSTREKDSGAADPSSSYHLLLFLTQHGYVQSVYKTNTASQPGAKWEAGE